MGHLADRLRWPIPPDLRRAKGWVGRLIETLLGAANTTGRGPDLPQLGVEIKTVPIDGRGRPRESTWVCTAPLGASVRTPWHRSPARAKLARVLWVAVQADPAISIADRRVGRCLLWSPSQKEDSILKQDWEELSNLIGSGWADSSSAHAGQALQLRPKGSNASARAWGIDDEGDPIRVRPLGFYLRRRFVEAILAARFQMGGR